MARRSMKGGSPASRLVMGGVKTSNTACNERFQAAYNTHDLSGMSFHMTTGGGKKKKGRKAKASKGKKSKRSFIMNRSKNRYILYGKNGRGKRSSKKKCGGKRSRK
jgi:hypothetical protein